MKKAAWLAITIAIIAGVAYLRSIRGPLPSPSNPPPSPDDGVEAFPLPADSQILEPAAMTPAAPAATPRYSLREANQRGLTTYRMTGTGASSGPSMVVEVTNVSGSPIDVFVAPGTVLTPSGGNAQSMVASGIVAVAVAGVDPQEATSLYLPDNTPRVALIEAYCLDFELANPEVQDIYSVAPEPAVAEAAVLFAAKRANLSVRATQVAIWKQRDDHITQQDIAHKFEASQKEFDDAFALVRRVHKTRANRPSS